MNPAQQEHFFGGDWTDIKLGLLSKYLTAYTTALHKQSFTLMYIDAFAGTGYRSVKSDTEACLLFDDEECSQAKSYLDGSARIALQTKPAFDKFVFIETATARRQELLKLQQDYPTKSNAIQVLTQDCNVCLPEICRSTDWKKHRAVLFLDPYGMQLHWSTMKVVAATQAIDVWLLFPLGVAVNRLLVRDGNIPDSWKSRLNNIFGTEDWYNQFYGKQDTPGFFGTDTYIKKTVDLDGIANYYCDRLGEIFPAVASNPKKLCNSKSSPLFLFCFAAGNPSKKASELALRIAENILGK